MNWKGVAGEFKKCYNELHDQKVEIDENPEGMEQWLKKLKVDLISEQSKGCKAAIAALLTEECGHAIADDIVWRITPLIIQGKHF